MNRPTVYLAGPITGAGYAGVTTWRDALAAQLGRRGIDALSPMRGKGYLKGEAAIADVYAAQELSGQRAIVARDRFDVRRCDLMIANLRDAARVSIGTMIEFGWASALGTPIVTVAPPGDHPHDHAFVRELSDHTVATLEEALAIACAYLLTGEELLATPREEPLRKAATAPRGLPGFAESHALDDRDGGDHPSRAASRP